MVRPEGFRSQPGLHPALLGNPCTDSGSYALEVISGPMASSPDVANGKFVVLDADGYSLRVVTGYPSQLPAAAWKILAYPPPRDAPFMPTVTLLNTGGSFGQKDIPWRTIVFDTAARMLKGAERDIIHDDTLTPGEVSEWLVKFDL